MVFPEIENSAEEIDELLQQVYSHFTVMWDKLRETYHCTIIQNNFEYPSFCLIPRYKTKTFAN